MRSPLLVQDLVRLIYQSPNAPQTLNEAVETFWYEFERLDDNDKNKVVMDLQKRPVPKQSSLARNNDFQHFWTALSHLGNAALYEKLLADMTKYVQGYTKANLAEPGDLVWVKIDEGVRQPSIVSPFDSGYGNVYLEPAIFVERVRDDKGKTRIRVITLQGESERWIERGISWFTPAMQLKHEKALEQVLRKLHNPRIVKAEQDLAGWYPESLSTGESEKLERVTKAAGKDTYSKQALIGGQVEQSYTWTRPYYVHVPSANGTDVDLFFPILKGFEPKDKTLFLLGQFEAAAPLDVPKQKELKPWLEQKDLESPHTFRLRNAEALYNCPASDQKQDISKVPRKVPATNYETWLKDTQQKLKNTKDPIMIKEYKRLLDAKKAGWGWECLLNTLWSTQQVRDAIERPFRLAANLAPPIRAKLIAHKRLTVAPVTSTTAVSEPSPPSYSEASSATPSSPIQNQPEYTSSTPAAVPTVRGGKEYQKLLIGPRGGRYYIDSHSGRKRYQNRSHLLK